MARLSWNSIETETDLKNPTLRIPSRYSAFAHIRIETKK